MRLRIYLFVLMCGVAIARAEDTNAVTNTNAVKDAKAPAAVEAEPGSFDEFKLITQRNIFDPNRRRPGAPRPAEERPKPVRIDYMNLVGAMSYEKGRFAFFDGSSSEYRKSVKPGDSIAGYKVADVTASKVTLESGDKKIELPVGGQLKREDEGEWHLNSTTESFASSGSSNSSSPSSSTSTATPGASSSSGTASETDETNPILKRLLEQRRQGK
jgi:hypothetical protein